MAKFYPIEISEMRDLLKPEKGWREETQGREVVFTYPIKSVPSVALRVYSGILLNGLSRGCGKDAIRVCAVDIVKHLGWIKAKRVHRVEGWKENLKARVLKVLEQSKARARENRN